MIVTAEDFGKAKSSGYGTVIVGSGPVGLILALFLARRHSSVLLVEGGNSFASSNFASDLGVDFTAAVLAGATIGRTRQIGGGLNLWGGQLASLQPCEFGSAISDWPIALREITDRFPTVTDLLGEPSISLPPSCNETVSEKSALAAVGLDVVATAWLTRPKLPARIWNELETSPTVTLVQGAFVDKILFDRSDGRVKGVSARANGKCLTLSGLSVVLTCGTIESCRLLLQTSSSGEAQPWHSLSWLGRGFNEHLDADTATIHPLNPKRLFDLFDPFVLKGAKYTYKIFCCTHFPNGQALSCIAMLGLPMGVRNSIAELKMLLRSLTPRDGPRHGGQIIRAIAASAGEIIPLAWRYLRHKRIGSVIRGTATLRVSVEQPIRAENRITLSPIKCDSNGVPVAVIHWEKGMEEGRVFLDATQRVKRWAEENAIADIRIDPLLLENPKEFVNRANDGLHHAGGTRMAHRRQDGVVDAELQVFGASGLYCCGASVFPRAGIANPTMTSMALAVRLGEHLIATGEAPT